MGSEWSEEQAGPQGPTGAPGPPGDTGPTGAPGDSAYVDTNIAYLRPGGGTAYSGTAEGKITNAFISGWVLNGYRHRITAHIPVQSTANGDVAILKVRAGGLITSPLVGVHTLYMPVANQAAHADFGALWEPSVSGIQAFTIWCARASGSGTLSVVVSAAEVMTLELLRMNAVGMSYF